MDLRRSQYNVLVQIRIGHIGLNAHLHKKKLVDSPNCPSCMARGDATRETLRHFLFECPSYRAERVVLTQALGRDARNLEAIFHERKGMYALLRYVGRTRRENLVIASVVRPRRGRAYFPKGSQRVPAARAVGAPPYPSRRAPTRRRSRWP
ncbi:hypothetical protein EV714DRAFT_215422 [Schizophyllum commune]